ncbi:MAG: hypothetical protein JWQ83_2211 [Lacunisphaera sp.]|nr:hypothetical protein [Lacunisphaera sp.]
MKQDAVYSVNRTQRRQVIYITVAALALYLGVRLLPTGTNLNHMDFRMEGKGALEFCDPANPQFIPVVEVRSPIALTLQSGSAPAAGQAVDFTLTLRTASGKPIAPEDLLVAHTRKLHLLVIDETLSDYQHIHPEPGRRAGEWKFRMTPTRPGLYRVFADFTPVATARGLYGVVEFTVPGSVPRVTRMNNATFDAAGIRFELATLQPLRARQPVDLVFRASRRNGQPVPLQPVMGAFAHLVAFDELRSGFAHLHPNQVDLAKPPDPVKPELTFKVTIPQPGRYVIWAQVKIEGEEIFAPFWTDVSP